MRKRKVEITVETERLILRGRTLKASWCEQCAAEVLMLAPTEAAALDRTTPRDIFRRVEVGELHFMETDHGAFVVCRNSLLSRARVPDAVMSPK